MKSDRILIVLAFGIILAALLSVNAVWATPEQSPDRQTVPTRTPKVPTSVPTPKEKDTPVPAPPKEKDTPVPPTAAATPTAQALASGTPANSPQTLPRAGASLPPMAWLSLVVLGGMALATGMILARTKE